MKATIFSIALLCATQLVRAEDVPDVNKAYAPDELQAVLTDMSDVDGFTGGVVLRYADVKMPGNGGLDIVVNRTYTSNSIIGTTQTSFTRSYAHEINGAGLGWSIMAAPRITVVNRRTDVGTWIPSALQRFCTGESGHSEMNALAMVVHLPDGQQMPLYGVQSGVARSKEFWQATCSNWIVTLKDPAGYTYTLENSVRDAAGNPEAPLQGRYTIGDNPTQFSFYTVYVATRKTDRNGNWLAYSYDPENRISPNRIDSSDGRWVVLNHGDAAEVGGKPQITSITASTGATWRYEYASAAPPRRFVAMRRVTLPTGDTLNYEYYEGPFTFGVGDFAGNARLKSRTELAGAKISYTYQHHRYTFTYGGPNWSAGDQSDTFRVVRVDDSTGGARTYSYAHGGLGQYDSTTMTDAAGTTVFRYFGSGYNWNGFSSAYNETTWRVGLLAEKQIGNLRTEQYSYQPIEVSPYPTVLGGGIEPQRDSKVWKAVVARYVVVSDGATFTTDRSDFDTFGNAGSVVESGPNGGQRTTRLTYLNDSALWVIGKVTNETTVGVGAVTRIWDARANLRSETRDGVTTGFTYHPSGDIRTITNARGYESTFLDYWRGTARSEVHPEGVNISRAVSEAGMVLSETNGEGKTTGYAYDGLNRFVRISPPVGHPTVITYTPSTRTVTRGATQQVATLDGFGRPINVSINGVSMSSHYDSLGRKVFSSIIGDPTVGRAFEYDILNRTTRITHTSDGSYRTLSYSSDNGVPTLSVRDERGYVTTHRYRGYGDADKLLLMGTVSPVAGANVIIERNGRDLVTASTQAGLTRRFNYDSRYYLTSTVHPETGVTVLGRDELGNMTSRKVGTSGVTTYEYDGRNRLWRVNYPNNNPSQVINAYFRTDKLRSTVNSQAARDYDYDDNQNLTGETLRIDGQALTATYNYNGNDHLSSVVYPVLGRLVQLNPDALGRPRQVTVPAGSMLGASFWPNGQIYDIAYAGGSRVTYGQNAREWVDSMTVRTGDGVARIANKYSYDVAGNLFNVSDGVDASDNRSSAYDGINRLTTANGPWGNGLVQYDGANNITSYALGASTRTYTYDSQNRLASVASSPGGTADYSYDAYGNASPCVGCNLYNNAGNLVSSTASNQQFAYDGTNTRVKVTQGQTTTYEFRSAKGLLLAEWRRQPGYYDVLKEHIHIAGKEVAEQRTNFIGSDIQPVSWMFLQPDLVGSAAAATWAGGGLLFKEGYQPYGVQLNGTAAAYTQGAFAGKKQDAVDLVYMGARYYNPQIGRFWSIDPKEADPSDLHSLNRYAYANNNPYKYVDPDGRSPVHLALFFVGMGVDAAVQYSINGSVNLTDAAIAGGAAVVTGGASALFARGVVTGTMTAGRAILNTASVGAAAGALSSAAQDAQKGNEVSLPNAAINAVAGAVGAGVGGKAATSTAGKVNNLASSKDGVMNHIGETTRGSNVGTAAAGAGVGEIAGGAAVDAGTNAAAKGLEQPTKKREGH